MNTKDTIPILYVGIISCKKKIKKVVKKVLKYHKKIHLKQHKSVTFIYLDKLKKDEVSYVETTIARYDTYHT